MINDIDGKSKYNIVEGKFSTGGHTAALVPVFAYGPGAENFGGIYQNAEIFDKMMDFARGQNQAGSATNIGRMK